MKQLAYRLSLFLILMSALNVQAQTDVLHLKSNVTDTIFGHVVEDPYRWMEDPDSDSLTNWLKEQKKIAKAEQGHFNGRMGDVYYKERFAGNVEYTQVQRAKGRFFAYSWSNRIFGQSWALYSRRTIKENYHIAFDPNIADWKHKYQIDNYAVNDSGNYLAVILSQPGSDWQDIRCSDIDSMQYFDDVIEHVKVSGVVWWGNGFFYGRYPDAGRWDTTGTQKLYYHKMGQKQDKDEVITSTPNGTSYRDIQYSVSSNQRYLMIGKNQKIGNTVYDIVAYKDLSEGLDAPFKHIVKTTLSDTCYYNVVDYADSGFIIYTDFKAPHGRILLADMNEANHFYELVHENEKVIKKVTFVGHQLIALYQTGGHYAVSMYNDTGGLVNALRFSDDLSISGFRGSPNDVETYFYATSFYTPEIVYKYSFLTGEYAPVEKTKVTFNPDDYKTEIISYKSFDGTDIPMYLTYKKGMGLKANNPVILSGYGGFSRSVGPDYTYENIVFFESSGILAVPMIRGGREEGSDWHAGARKLNKQNAFDDFTAAAEYLIKEGYTSKDRLALNGETNGGLLVAAVMIQHPGLCKVVVARSGIFDMLRYHKFTYGKYWKGEYGNPDNPAEFNNLLRYSPLHNLKPGVNYPATLLVASRKVNRVVPMHTFKFLARLQECSTPDNPHILYFEEDADHTAATGYLEHRETNAFVLAFIFTQMHLPIKYVF